MAELCEVRSGIVRRLGKVTGACRPRDKTARRLLVNTASAEISYMGPAARTLTDFGKNIYIKSQRPDGGYLYGLTSFTMDTGLDCLVLLGNRLQKLWHGMT